MKMRALGCLFAACLPIVSSAMHRVCCHCMLELHASCPTACVKQPMLFVQACVLCTCLCDENTRLLLDVTV